MVLDIKFLQKWGFSKPIKVSKLKISNCDEIPTKRGVYIVLRNADERPNFEEILQCYLRDGKEKPLFYSITELNNRWEKAKNKSIIYVGKAGGSKITTTLKERIKTYISFGTKAKQDSIKINNICHRGGRAIWQIKDSDDLLFTWKTLLNDEPRNYEAKLIEMFNPFANKVK